MEKNLPAMPETQVQFLGQEDSLEEEMETHSCLENFMDRGAWQSVGLQRVGHNWATEHCISKGAAGL